MRGKEDGLPFADRVRKMDEELDLNALAGAAGIGAVAGLRSMTAPALVSQAARTGSIELTTGPVAFLGRQKTADIMTGIAVAELVADKLPSTPDRIEPFPLAARAISGAIVGAAVYSARRKDPGPGALVGALAAIGAAFLGFALRRKLTRDVKVAGFLVGLVEDALAVGIAVVVLRSEADARPVAD
jgi:uncharacterized membrane protein